MKVDVCIMVCCVKIAEDDKTNMVHTLAQVDAQGNMRNVGAFVHTADGALDLDDARTAGLLKDTRTVRTGKFDGSYSEYQSRVVEASRHTHDNDEILVAAGVRDVKKQSVAAKTIKIASKACLALTALQVAVLWTQAVADGNVSQDEWVGMGMEIAEGCWNPIGDTVQEGVAAYLNDVNIVDAAQIGDNGDEVANTVIDGVEEECDCDCEECCCECCRYFC